MATATTPNSHRQATQSHNSRSHSVRTISCAQLAGDGRPPAPPFVEQQLRFVQALGGASAGTAELGPTSVPMQTSRIDGRAAAAAAAAASRKRAAVEQEDTRSPDTADKRQAKRPRGTGAGQPLAALSVNAAAAGIEKAADGTKRKSRKTYAGAEKEKLQHESQQWRAKYRKAFPSFTFYFDAIDDSTKASLSAALKKLGASVDNFFSKKVTHVVTSRPLPVTSGKENDGAAASKASTSASTSTIRSKKQSARSPKTYELPNGQKLWPLASATDHEKNPFIDSQDILSKALDFGLKVWASEKLQLIIDRINHASPSKDKAALQRDPSLPTLLRDEQLYGTRERDPLVARNDMYYFPSTKSYLLVEDSTGEHRPIVVKEYDRPKKNEVPSWPILWGGIEGRTGFYYYDGPEITYERRVPPRPAPPPAAETSGKAGGGGGFGSTAARAVAPNLRRAVSLQNVARGQQATYGYVGYEPVNDRRDSYIAASGNSQIITSNIQSATSTAARSGAPQANRFGNPYVDKRLAVLSNRTVSVAGGSILGSGSTAGGSGGVASGGAGSGGRLAALKRSERPGALKRSLSVDGHLARVPNPPVRDEPKKAGYCENCRIKYDCFREHVRSSKHRRFALNPKNWADLDKLLERIARKPLEGDKCASSELAADEGEYEDSGYFDASVLAGEGEECDDGEGGSTQDDEDELTVGDEDEQEEGQSSTPLEAQVLAQAVRA
ncbi:regulatory subunitfor Cdc7p protein kinase [Rhodotorula toruloides]|uniref:Regulatory subunitfor Cdc7p protein kinase n=1 Tax=Rhodotorula toruloides TaxID=5286 RepID=A0A511KC51_RHOTO|nr:regulatory subunitfor Cdc7p protein kinase [Rhodotorula toruloides]